MIDPLALATSAVTSNRPQAALLMFAAGALTSAGPCVAARYVLLSGLANASARPARTIGAFVCGLVIAYVALAGSAGALARLTAGAGALNAVLAVLLGSAGVYAIVAAPAGDGAQPACAHRTVRRPADSTGAAFLLGGASALTVSPCCAPVIAAVVAVATTAGHALHAAVLLGSYAAGHALLLLCCGGATSIFARRIARFGGLQAPTLIGGTLMVALGAYYAVLA